MRARAVPHSAKHHHRLGQRKGWIELIGVAETLDEGKESVDRAFQIEPRDGGVLFVMSEECTGWLTPVMFATNLEAQLYRGYDAFNDALRRRVEGAG